MCGVKMQHGWGKNAASLGGGGVKIQQGWGKNTASLFKKICFLKLFLLQIWHRIGHNILIQTAILLSKIRK